MYLTSNTVRMIPILSLRANITLSHPPDAVFQARLLDNKGVPIVPKIVAMAIVAILAIVTIVPRGCH